LCPVYSLRAGHGCLSVLVTKHGILAPWKPLAGCSTRSTMALLWPDTVGYMCMKPCSSILSSAINRTPSCNDVPVPNLTCCLDALKVHRHLRAVIACKQR
jgi:hypothetical protein